MSVFKRIGTDRHKFKLQFFLKSMACNAKLKGDVYIKAKRGDHKVTSQKKISLQDDGTCDFGKQILTFEALTLFFDPDKKQYQQKQVLQHLSQGQLTVVIITKKGEKKLLGSFQFDVAQWANSGKQNIQVSKQFGDKIKAVLDFDVFIKYLGEASQTSKSIDKPFQKKKQSSLSKFTSFFTGSKQESPDDKKHKKESPEQQKKPNIKKKKEEDNENRRSISKQADKVFKNKYKQPQNEQKRVSQQKQDKYASKNIVKRSQNVGSQKKIAEKQKKKNESDQDDQQTPEKPKKTNLVAVKQKDNLTSVQQSEADANVKKAKKQLSTPQQQPIYFDQPNLSKKQNDTGKVDERPNKMKRTQNFSYGNVDGQQDLNQKKINQFQTKINTNQNEKVVKQLKDKNLTLEKQNKELKNQNAKLIEEKNSLSKKMEDILSKSNSRDDDFYQTERDAKGKNKVDDQRVRNLQKQKGELLVKIQRMQQKYKKDFQKYEEQLQRVQEEKGELQQVSKGEIKRMKDQFSQQKEKYDKLMAKYEQKANQSKQFKQRQNDLKERLAIAQNSLSELKLKIGDKLNEANEDGNKTVIDILTLLSE